MRFIFEEIRKYGNCVVAVECPPGYGKTLSAIEKALEYASNGNTVIYALPNHTSLLTGFAYAVTQYANMAKRLPKQRLPYLVYYEGINRFCPFFSKGGQKLFERALDYMLSHGYLDRVLYERVRDLPVGEVARIYGSMFVCKYLCPIYKLQKYFDKERIFASGNMAEVERRLSSLALLSEVRDYVVKATEKLGALKKRGLVAFLAPKFDGKEPGGYCLRAVLQKAVTTRKTQIVMKGALILTPVQALDFLLTLVESKVSALRKRGLNIPYPYVILDEYDFYVYRPKKIPLFTVKYAEKELELAKEVVASEVSKKQSGDPSYDWERLVAGMVAYFVLQKLLGEYRAFKESSGGGIAPAGGIANVFAEAASEPVMGEGIVVPPFAPRKLIVEPVRAFINSLYDMLEQEHKEALQEGVFFYDPDDVRALGLKHFLALWENILVKEGRGKGLEFMAPALYKAYGNVYRVGYTRYPRLVSVAKSVADLATSTRRKFVTLFYRVIRTGRDVYADSKQGPRKVSKGGGLVVYGTYDPRFFRLLADETESRIILMSATGLPWYSQFYLTRSAGEGRATRKGRHVASPVVTSAFKGFKFAVAADKSFMYLRAQGVYVRPIIAVSPNPSAIYGYVAHGSIVPAGELPILPQGGSPNYIAELGKAVERYAHLAGRLIERIIKGRPKDLGMHPAVFVLAQRKDVAATFLCALKALLRKVGAKADVCVGTDCTPVSRTLRERGLKGSLSDMLKLVRELKASHFLLRFPIRGSGQEFRVFVTWVRSRMSRGVDLPSDTVAYAVMLVGSPYRPPESFDILPKAGAEASQRASQIAQKIYVGRFDSARAILLVHNPIDIAESVNEFVQACGRALRRAWAVTMSRGGRMAYRVAIVIPAFTRNKIYTYAPLWFRAIFEQ